MRPRVAQAAGGGDENAEDDGQDFSSAAGGADDAVDEVCVRKVQRRRQKCHTALSVMRTLSVVQCAEEW